jgi:TPR repeat protein
MDAVEAEDNQIPCPFCRTPAHASDGEWIERIKKRAEADDAEAMRNLGCYYRDGEYGLRQNHAKAMKLWLRAGELGFAMGYYNIGYAYVYGEGVEVDTKKAKYYFEFAAMGMGGNVYARHNLGILEKREGNMNRAVKHWMISAGAGFDDSLKAIRQCYLEGHATKDDFEKALRTHKEAADEMKSDQRDAADVARGQN